MKCHVIPCRQDNYAYLLVADGSNVAVVIDPSEAAPVREVLDAEGLSLGAIWNTHHHYDHVGGNDDLTRGAADIAVVAHSSDRGRVPAFSRGVEGGEDIHMAGLSAKVIHNPGHTSGAISFLLSEGLLFTGDTLFASGCGRLFEGSPDEMHESLQTLAGLPKRTEVYCGHEYTVANLEFCAVVEPENPAVIERLDAAKKTRADGGHTMGFTLEDELATNVFLRTSGRSEHSEVRRAAEEKAGSSLTEGTEIFGALRRWKDSFTS